MWRCLVLLCACDGVLGLRASSAADAADGVFFDAPIDGPFACTIGTTPAFSPLVHPYIVQDCSWYSHSVAANLAAAICTSASVSAVAVGPIGGPLAPAVGVDMQAPPLTLAQVWVTPEGDTLIVREDDGTTIRYRRYLAQSDRSWLATTDLGISSAGATFSGLSAGPTPHLVHYDTQASFEELADDGTNTWTTHVHTYTTAELGVSLYTNPRLSADGLRLTFTGAPAGMPTAPQQIFYTDRPSITDTFRSAEPLANVPLHPDAFMFDDCSRVAFSTGELDYVQHM